MATAEAISSKGLGNGSDVFFPEGGVLVNKVTGIVHMVKDDHTTGCGIQATETKFEYHNKSSAILDKPL